jgi:hypothetical protein
LIIAGLREWLAVVMHGRWSQSRASSAGFHQVGGLQRHDLSHPRISIESGLQAGSVIGNLVGVLGGFCFQIVFFGLLL